MKFLGDVFQREFIFGLEPTQSRRVRRVWVVPELKTYPIRWEQFSRGEWVKLNPEISAELELLFQQANTQETPITSEPKISIEELSPVKRIPKKKRENVIHETA